MIRNLVLGLGVLLVAGIVGLVSVDAQEKSPAPSAGDLRKVQAFQTDFNKAMGKLEEAARKAGKVKPGFFVVVSTKAFKNFIDTKAVVGSGADANFLSIQQARKLKTKVIGRMETAKKKGLTPLDREILAGPTMNKMATRLGVR